MDGDFQLQPWRSRHDMTARIVNYLDNLGADRLPGFLGEPSLAQIAKAVDVPYSALRKDECARAAIDAHAKTHGVYESHPRRYAGLQIALQEYAERKRIAGESIPSYPGRPETPDYRVIAGDMGYDYEREWLGRVNALDYIKRELADIPLGAPIRTAADEAAIRAATKEKFGIFDAALTATETSRTPLPESLLKPGQPDYEAIGALFDVVPIRFQQAGDYRKRLLKAIEVVGLKRRSFNLGNVDFTLTYSDLIQEVVRRRLEETKDTQTSAQSVANSRYALKAFMTACGRTEADDCTEDLSKNFQASLITSEKYCKSHNTRKKHRSELTRIQKYYENLERQACHPTTLSGALNSLMDKSGLSFRGIQRQTGCREEILRTWTHLDSHPSPENTNYLKILERFFGLAAGTLTRFVTSNIPRTLSQRDVEKAVPRKLAARCLPYLPDNFVELSLTEQRTVVEFVKNNILKQSREEHYLERIGDTEEFQLRLDKWPHHMLEQWDAICDTKQARILPDDIFRRPKTMWNEGGKNVMISRLQGYFGYLTLSEKRGGKALPISSLSFVMLLDTSLLKSYVKWREKRRGGIMVSWDSGTAISFAGLLDPKFGALTQLPLELRRLERLSVVFSEEQQSEFSSSWLQCCTRAASLYKKLASEIDEQTEVSRDPFEPILGFLNNENPRQAYYNVILSMDNHYPDEGRYPIPFHAHRRDCVLMRLTLILALRRKNMAKLTYRSNNKGSLRFVDGLWTVIISRKEFKNSDSSFFKSGNEMGDYVRVLPDEHGLYELIDQYLLESRPYLLGNKKSNSFFVTSKSSDCSENAFGQIFRNITQEFFAHNPYRNTGVPGVMPHGPHAIRAVVATDIVKKTGRFDVAATAIQDTEAMVREHYGRFLTEDKHRLLDEYNAREGLQTNVSAASDIDLKFRIKELETQLMIAKEQLKQREK